VGQSELLPRLPTAAQSARSKSPGEIVTAADLAAEAVLTAALAELTPGAVIVGEEAAHADPSLLSGLDVPPLLWLVDPLDGTRHFAEGHGPFGIMVALLVHGRCEAAWIHLPLSADTAAAWRGRGATWNGQPIRIPAPATTPLRGGLLTRFMPPEMRARADELDFLERTDGAHHCAARRYLDVLRGDEHVSAYWRTLPWDHVPGALLVQEAGGRVARFDGSSFDAADVEGTGLIVAANAALWERTRTALA